MSNISVDIRFNETVKVDIDVTEIVEALNDLEMPTRFNTMARILNGINLRKAELTHDQKLIVKDYLKKISTEFEKEE